MLDLPKDHIAEPGDCSMRPEGINLFKCKKMLRILVSKLFIDDEDETLSNEFKF